MKDKAIVKIVAILSIAGIECLAIMKGMDGIVLSLVVGAISGIAGYELRNSKGFQNYLKQVKRNFKLLKDIIVDVFKGG